MNLPRLETFQKNMFKSLLLKYLEIWGFPGSLLAFLDWPGSGHDSYVERDSNPISHLGKPWSWSIAWRCDVSSGGVSRCALETLRTSLRFDARNWENEKNERTSVKVPKGDGILIFWSILMKFLRCGSIAICSRTNRFESQWDINAMWKSLSFPMVDQLDSSEYLVTKEIYTNLVLLAVLSLKIPGRLWPFTRTSWKRREALSFWESQVCEWSIDLRLLGTLLELWSMFQWSQSPKLNITASSACSHMFRWLRTERAESLDVSVTTSGWRRHTTFPPSNQLLHQFDFAHDPEATSRLLCQLSKPWKRPW